MSKFKKQIAKTYGDEVHFGTQSVHCWDTGSYNLNSNMGGGVPAGRISLFVGKQSVGKSSIANKIAGSVNTTHYETGKKCDPAILEACKVLYVDSEGTLDQNYAACHNYFPEDGGNVLLSTTTGNQAVDIVNAGIQSLEFSMIIVDSLEALIPYKDLEKSSEDFNVGTRARMLNDGFRRWTVSIIDAARQVEHWWQRPTLVCINQLRDNIGTTPGPPVIPGGVAQRQAASVIVQLNTPKYANDGKLASKVNIRGVVKKNKVGTPRGGIDFFMAVKDLPEEGLSLGEVDNCLSIIQDARKYKVWQKNDDGQWELFGYKADKQEEFLPMMRSDPQIEYDIMTQMIEWLKK